MMDYDDLVQTAALGIAEALPTYDPGKDESGTFLFYCGLSKIRHTMRKEFRRYATRGYKNPVAFNPVGSGCDGKLDHSSLSVNPWDAEDAHLDCESIIHNAQLTADEEKHVRETYLMGPGIGDWDRAKRGEPKDHARRASLGRAMEKLRKAANRMKGGDDEYTN